MARFGLKLTERTIREVADSYAWYEKEQPGLGLKFKNVVRQRWNELLDHPLRYPIRNGRQRLFIMDEFPYLIVYRVNQRKKIVTITSVFHTSRNPKKRFGRK